MALSAKTFDGTDAIVAVPGTSVAPTLALPDNCHTVICLNPSATATAWIANAAPGGALTIANATQIPPGAAVALAIGVQSRRAGNSNLAIDSSAAQTLNVTYVNQATA